MEHDPHTPDPATGGLAGPSLFIDPAAMEPLSRGAGIVTIPYVGEWNSDLAVTTTAVTRIAVGSALPMHSHNVEEAMLVIEGTGVAEAGGGAVDLAFGKLAWVPAGVQHRLVNTGDVELAVFTVFGAREVTRTVTDTGETTPQFSVQGTGARR